MFVFLTPYRATGVQTFRRNEIIRMLDNVKTYFAKHSVELRVVIAEQNDNEKFNRGLLLNAAFLEAEKLFPEAKAFLHFNVDYTINISRPFPQELHEFTSGFIDLHRPGFPVLGAACVFDRQSYRTIGGFPNDLIGWGGDDWAIYNRIVNKRVPIYTPTGLYNSGFVVEYNEKFAVDTVNNEKNMSLSTRDDSDTNGVSTCTYSYDGVGEFHDGAIVHHFLIH